MTDDRNVETLKAGYQAWAESKGTSVQEWLKVASPDIAFRSTAEAKPNVGVRALSGGGNAVADYLEDVAANWEMQRFSVERFVSQGDTVAAIADCAWTNRATGKAYAGKLAHFWTFRDGLAVEFQEFLDTAELVAAATPDS